MMCQKTITEPVISQKQTYNVVDGEPDHKRPKILRDDSWNLLDCDKSIRAAMIRSRFADTILKSQQKTIFNQGNEAEKKILQKKKADIEAKLRAAKMVLKMQREKDRQAARLAIESIQRTVEWNDALHVTQEFEKLIGDHINPIRPFTRDFFQW